MKRRDKKKETDGIVRAELQDKFGRIPSHQHVSTTKASFDRQALKTGIYNAVMKIYGSMEEWHLHLVETAHSNALFQKYLIDYLYSKDEEDVKNDSTNTILLGFNEVVKDSFNENVQEVEYESED